MLIFDQLVKGKLFGCQQCGQCLLSQTAYICPMTCPKGLRNGPCGGTIDGKCEVLPDEDCIWVRIEEKTDPGNSFHSPVDHSLFNSSSFGNFISGRDKETRTPKPISSNKISIREISEKIGRTENQSIFAARLNERTPVITYEIVSPKTADGLPAVAEKVKKLKPWVDAINTTTNAGGIPSLHSLETARTVAANGVPPIVQICGRDQNEAEFSELCETALADGFANILALTGDWNPNTDRERSPQHWFPMDSLQMVELLNRQQQHIKQPCIGVASNPYSAPMNVSVDRLKRKIAAGAYFTQTQAITEINEFSRWLAAVRKLPGGRDVKIIASIPLVGKPKLLEVLQRLAGVKLEPEFLQTLKDSSCLEKTGIEQAKILASNLLDLDIQGLHLMNFGVSVESIIELVDSLNSVIFNKSVNKPVQ